MVLLDGDDKDIKNCLSKCDGELDFIRDSKVVSDGDDPIGAELKESGTIDAEDQDVASLINSQHKLAEVPGDEEANISSVNTKIDD